MPQSSPRLCNGCGGIVRGKCPNCYQPGWTRSKHPGGTRARTKAKRAMLAEQPLCAWPGCKALATQDDHIIPLAWNGADADRANHQGLCDQHHARKTQAESRAGRTAQTTRDRIAAAIRREPQLASVYHLGVPDGEG